MSDLDRAIQTAFDELDPQQMEIFRRMSAAEKAQGVANLFDAMRELAIVSEQNNHPELSQDEIRRRAMMRWMRASEWETWLRQIIFNS